MIKLGDYLKSKRKEKGIEISQASESTKIPQHLLVSMEEGNFEVFASEVYLKGFLKNYAKLLGIDTQKVLALYRREKKSLQEHIPITKVKHLEEARPIITPGRLVFFIAFLVVISVIGFIVIQINKIVQPPLLSLKEPIELEAPNSTIVEVTGNSINLAGKVEVGSKLFINGSEVTTNNLQEFRIENFKVNPGSNEISILAQGYYFSKTSEIKLTVIAKEQSTNETSEETSSGNDIKPPPANEMKVQFDVSPDSAWVVATVDGVTKVSATVKGGSKFSFTAKETFSIYSPRPQMIKLFINDIEYTFASQEVTAFKLVNGSVVQQ
jgi:cytoskeletal protein RodZ